MPDQPQDVPQQPQPPVQVINQPSGPVSLAGSMGLKGVAGTVGNMTAMALVAVAFWYLLRLQVEQSRVDRLDDRQLFRESVRDIQTRADERAGQVKGSMDSVNGSLHELIAELRSARKAGLMRADTPLPAAPPGGP
jgi:hypothetical protein